MSSFTEKLCTTQISVKPRRWQLEKDFLFYKGYECSETWIKVKEKFVCDGGSIFRFLWWLDSPTGDGAQAYFLHDLMYRARIGTRKFADETLMEALKVLKMRWFRRWLIYIHVRMYAWVAWNSNTPTSIAKTRQFADVSLNLKTW